MPTGESALDPAFAQQGKAPGWLTTLPARRGPTFYDLDAADPAVFARDESAKDVTSTLEIENAIVELETPARAEHLALGYRTRPRCAGRNGQPLLHPGHEVCTAAAVKSNEASYYRGAASFDVATLPRTAHALHHRTHSRPSIGG